MGEAPALTDEELRRTAGFLLHAYLAGRKLPESISGVRDDEIVDRLMRADAKELLETLRELYGVEWWSRGEFQRAFVDGALAGWRPGERTASSASQLRVLSATCPIAEDVEGDARLCAACQALQCHAARLAMRGQVEDVAFDQLMSRGDAVCEMRVRFRNVGEGSSPGPAVSERTRA